LRIITLGTFAVVRGREVVPVTEWRSRQARELLQVLIARRGQPIGRQALADLLWPGESGSQIGNRLSVLLSTVRRILDPLREHDPGFAVRAEDNAISLQTDRIHIDVIELLHLVREGIQLIKRRSLDHAETVLRHANQLYRGEFLAENPYADWAVDMRNEALDAAQSALRHLADIAVMRHDDEAAATHLRRLLELDQYDERSWQTLIGCLVRLQRHGEARRQHARYAKLMNELDVTATPMAALTPDP
jgi:DNA-binding SARP family transcriptional activator